MLSSISSISSNNAMIHFAIHIFWLWERPTNLSSPILLALHQNLKSNLLYYTCSFQHFNQTRLYPERKFLWWPKNSFGDLEFCRLFSRCLKSIVLYFAHVIIEQTKETRRLKSSSCFPSGTNKAWKEYFCQFVLNNGIQPVGYFLLCFYMLRIQVILGVKIRG